MRFRATLESAGKTATGVEVPERIVTALGAGKRPRVRVTIGDHMYRSSVAVMGGRFMLGVSAENRQAAGVAAGDVVDIDLELDTAPREVATPAELAAALAGDPAARAAYEALSYSAKQRLVLPIEGAKTDETRRRRVARALESLGGNGPPAR